MPVVLRAVVLLAAVTPLFAATAFHPAWWQILIAAAVGSAAGQLAVRATRNRRGATWAVVVLAILISAGATAWIVAHQSPEPTQFPSSVIVTGSRGQQSSLTWEDVQAIQTELPEIRVAAPYLHTKVALASEASNWNTDLIGATPEYFQFWSVHPVAGAVFDAGSEDKVVVLGETIVTQLFPGNRKPIGEEIRIGGLPYTVVGVLEHRGLASTGQDLDDIAIIPMRTFVRKIARGPRFDGTVLIAPASRHDTARVEQALRSLLRDRHRLAPGADDDFEIRVPFAK